MTLNQALQIHFVLTKGGTIDLIAGNLPDPETLKKRPEPETLFAAAELLLASKDETERRKGADLFSLVVAVCDKQKIDAARWKKAKTIWLDIADDISSVG